MGTVIQHTDGKRYRNRERYWTGNLDNATMFYDHHDAKEHMDLYEVDGYLVDAGYDEESQGIFLDSSPNLVREYYAHT